MSDTPLRGGPAREAELLGAVLDELREKGYAGLTVEAAVKRARASKQTVYRRWPSKAELVAAAFSAAVTAPPETPESGNLREDMLAVFDALQDELTTLGDVIGDLMGDLRRNETLATVLRESYIQPRVAALLAVIERARERGEIAPDADVELIWQLAPATFSFRALISGAPVDREVAERLVDNVMLPLLRPKG